MEDVSTLCLFARFCLALLRADANTLHDFSASRSGASALCCRRLGAQACGRLFGKVERDGDGVVGGGLGEESCT